MTFYIKDWHSHLKETIELEPNINENFIRSDLVELDSDLDSTDTLESRDEQTTDNDSTLNSLNKSNLKIGKSKNQNETVNSTNDDNEAEYVQESYEFIYNSIEDLETDKLLRAIYLLFGSVCSLALVNCLLLGFLINYLLTNNKLTGLLFLQSTLVLLTCYFFYYPSHKLTTNGYVVLRVLRWIYYILGTSSFFYLLRSHTQSCSSIVLSLTIGVKLFRDLPYTFPQTFTFNELAVICSFVACAVFTFIMHSYKIIQTNYLEVTIVEHAIIWLIITVYLTRKLKFIRSSFFAFSTLCVFLLAVYFVPTCFYVISQNPFVWLFNFLFNSTQKRILLFIVWIVIFNFMGLILSLKKIFSEFSKLKYKNTNTDSANKQSLAKSQINLTTMRKFFHLLIVIVYITGLTYDKMLLYLCSYGMLILLLLIETIRYFKIGKLSRVIQEYMGLFLDEKDMSSKLILSHIYLLVGLSYPLWVSNKSDFEIADLSGIITVGIGDSFASIIGSRYGRRKFFGAKKSIEGSLALIISQFLAFLFMHYISLFNLFNLNNILFILVSLLLSSYVEAFTCDNDNLILPIVVYPFLKLIK